jgi:hypothetical protein
MSEGPNNTGRVSGTERSRGNTVITSVQEIGSLGNDQGRLENLLFDPSQLSSLIKHGLNAKWQERWDNSAGKIYHQLLPRVSEKVKTSCESRYYEVQLNKFLTGNVDLNCYRFKMGLCATEKCTTCNQKEDIVHFITECSALNSACYGLRQHPEALNMSVLEILSSRELFAVVRRKYLERVREGNTGEIVRGMSDRDVSDSEDSDD